MEPERKSENKSVWKEVGPYINMGWTMVVTIGLGVLIGWWIDNRYDTKPTGILIGSITGCVVGMYNFIRSSLQSSSKTRKKKNE